MVQKQQNLIKLASPDIRKSDINRAVNAIKSGNLVEGSNVILFEKELSSFTKIKYSTLVSSATAGLHLVLKALGIKKDHSIIVPSFTFPATANVVENIGANTIFCDVDLKNYVLEPDKLEQCILKNLDNNLKAIIVVQEFGFPAQIKKIAKIAKKYNLKLIEDAACALGTIANDQHVGYYSDAAVFSFHPRKAITSGEGGAIVTKNGELLKKVKILKNHGIVRVANDIDFIEAGLNYRMTDFQAALMIGQLKRFENEIARRKKLVNIYYKHLKNEKLITLPKLDENHSWQSFMILLDEKINRVKLINYFQENQIQVNLGAQSLPMLSYYKNKYNLNLNDYKNSNKLFTNGLVLPLYGKLKKKDIIRVIKILIKYINNK